MNCLMSDAPYAPWLMDALKLIEEEGVEKLMVAGITAKGEVMTGYPLNDCPSAVQLLEMIYNAVVRG